MRDVHFLAPCYCPGEGLFCPPRATRAFNSLRPISRSMASLQFSTSLLGLGLAALILILVRRDHLYLLHGLFWVAVAAAAAVLGAWPGLIDRLAVLVGISYPPALLLLLAAVVLLLKALHADMLNTRIERDVRRLNQRLAILEADLATKLSESKHPPNISRDS